MKPGDDLFAYRQIADAFMATNDGQWAIHHDCAFPVWCYVAKCGTAPTIADLDRIAVHTAGREKRLCFLANVSSLDQLGDSANAYLSALHRREGELAELFATSNHA